EMSPHAFEPSQVASQVPLVHDRLPHALPALPELVQCVVQLAVSHVMLPHARSLPHVTSHDCAIVHEMSPHAAVPLQLLVQSQPAGHVIAPLPVPVIVQVLLPKLHCPHCGGQIATSIGASIAASIGLPITQ